MKQSAHEFYAENIESALEQQASTGNLDVPMLPEVASKVVRLTQHPDSDAAELAQLIQSDQPLAAHVMRVANSAAYSPNASLVSLQQAITRLGMRVIAEIALSASINSKLFNTPGYEKYIAHILRSSFAAGLWAKEVARQCRKNVEAAFLAALLKDIGRPVVVQTALACANKNGTVLDNRAILKLEAKFSHAFGLKVLNSWEMPNTVKDVLRYYGDYQHMEPKPVQTIIVVAGCAISDYFCRTSTGDKREDLLTHPAFAAINLYRDEVETILLKENHIRSALEAMSG